MEKQNQGAAKEETFVQISGTDAVMYTTESVNTADFCTLFHWFLVRGFVLGLS